jgi:DNA repair/transcription protein MET18/MMS19
MSCNYLDAEPSAAYAYSILKTLANTLARKVDLAHADIPNYIDRLIPHLYNLFIFSAVVSDGTYMVATEPRLVRVAAQIVTLVIQTVPFQYVLSQQSAVPVPNVIFRRQESFAAALFAAYLSGDVKRLAEGHWKMPSDSNFLPFSVNFCDLSSIVQKL